MCLEELSLTLECDVGTFPLGVQLLQLPHQIGGVHAQLEIGHSVHDRIQLSN